ncbi:MAG: hypothetical protein ABI787_03005 [Spartobacteria bacterium]
MIKKFISCLVAVTVCGAASVVAQQSAGDSPAGTLKLDKKTYPLKRVLAYETTTDEESAIAVVLSGSTISGAKLKEAREAEKEGSDGDFDKPFVKLVFSKTGELMYWSARAGGTTLGHQSGQATGTIKIQGNRVSGQASQPFQGEGMFPSGFDARFDVALLKAGESLPESAAKKQGPAANVKPTVNGLFKGNGKEAKLAYVSAKWGEPFDGKAGIVLIISEKDHSKDPKPDFNVSFGKFGSALLVSLHEDGGIYGCEVIHRGLKRPNFSSIGTIEATDFAYEDGKVEGNLTTSGPAEFFDDTWEVNIKFTAPLGPTPKELEPKAEPAAEEKPTQPNETTTSTDSADEPAPKPAGEIKAKDLALTKDATGVDYQSIVEQIVFQSKADVKKVCAELAANLKAQGWTSDGPDMVQPASSILRRKRGEASLTIFVKPANGGSEVKMMTEGLAWEGE